MPGVLTIEAIAQAGAVAVLADPRRTAARSRSSPASTTAASSAIVEPGDVLTLECEFVRVRGPIAKGQGRATVDGELAAEAMLTVFVAE